MTLIDLLDGEETLTTEQAALDEHDDLVTTLTVRILALVNAASPTSPREVSVRELLEHRCKWLESRLSETETALTSLSHKAVCRLQHYHEQTLDYKKEIAEISNTLLSLTLDESDALPSMIADLEKKLFDCSLHLRELSHSGTTRTLPTPPDPKGIKLVFLHLMDTF